MNKYRISYITTIYGVEPYIAKFAESFLGQTYDDIQFIFVNDGTKDASMDILHALIEERFSHLKERITLINKENEGLPLARKSGLDAAEGEYVLFADADDWVELNLIERVMDVADKTHADIIYFDIVKEYGTKRSIKHEREYTAATRELWIENIFNYRAQGYTATKCFRRALYTDNLIYTPKLGMHEDMYLMAQLICRAESIVHLPEVLYHYRKDNENAMCSQRRKVRHIASSRNMLDLYSKFMDNLAESPIKDVADGLVLRAGWHYIIHKCDLYEEYPWLGDAIRKARLSTTYRTPFLFQLIVKCYNALFH